MNYTLYDILGNLGVFLIILGYLLLQLNKVESKDLSYSVMNLIGAGFILISLLVDFNLSAFIVEAFWILISLIGIINYILNTKKHNKHNIINNN